MSEMAVLVIKIRAEQADDYEHLFEQSELPSWRDYHQRGLFKQARIFPSAFGSNEREGLANYVIVVEMEGEGHHEHDSDTGFQAFNRQADGSSPRIRSCSAANRSSRSAEESGRAARVRAASFPGTGPWTQPRCVIMTPVRGGS